MIRQKYQKKNFVVEKKNINVDNIVISNLVETNDNSQYLIQYLDEVIRPLVVILPKMSGYGKLLKRK